jgi:hypothetical protein
MHQVDKAAIHTLFDTNNILVIFPHSERKKATEDISPLTIIGHTLAENQHCYAVINSKYKPSITDMNDVLAM